MDGLQELVHRTREFHFMGRVLRLSQLRLRHYAEIEAEVLARKPTPLAVVAETVRGMPAEQAKYLLGLAYDDSIKVRRAAPHEIDEFLTTIHGLAFMFWLALRDAQPEITRDEVAEWVLGLDEPGVAELQDELDKLEPPRGNVGGRQNQPAVASDSPQPGAASSANSVNGTTGAPSKSSI